MCKSVRGAAFFGSSLHLAFSFLCLFWFIFDTVISEININLWKCDPPEKKFSDLDPLAHYLNLLFKLVYFSALCVIGIYIFRGVERERPQVLQYATLGFIIVQILGVVLFSVFFSIQWNAEPDSNGLSSSDNPETARLFAAPEDLPEVPVLDLANPVGVNLAEPSAPPSITDILKTVTPMVSESVLQAPDVTLNESTTTTPMPPPPVVVLTTTIHTTTMAPTTTTQPPPPPPPAPCYTQECSHLSPKPQPRRRLPHNQLVSLVFQMCLVVANGLGSVAYVIVLALYMVRL